MQETKRIGEKGDFEICIGSHPTKCRVRIPELPGLAPVHAILRRVGDRLFIRDCGSSVGTYLNGARLPRRRWEELTRDDRIWICEKQIQLSPLLFQGRIRKGVVSTELEYSHPRRKRIICDGIYIQAEPGTLTAVMGPSGCGKTTFLSLINGYQKAVVGEVLLADEEGGYYHLHTHLRQMRGAIGYVPQDSVLIPELTVRQSLNYRLKMQFPDMAASIRRGVIQETVKRLGIREDRLELFLDTIIGASGSRYRGLSGGERKRANIAHELITQPLILFLDEPTSGLSSVDADQIVDLLRNLAIDDHLTIIASVHQPGQEAFSNFHNLLLLTEYGQVAYYGAANEAAGYFERTTGVRFGGKNPAEYVLTLLDDERYRDSVAPTFRKQRTQLPAKLQPLAGVDELPLQPLPTPRRTWLRLLKPFFQWSTLLARNLTVLRKDRPNLCLLLGQVPLIGLLIFWAFQGFGGDTHSADLFARSIHHFQEMIAPVIEQKGTIQEAWWKEALERAEEDTFSISSGGSRSRGAIYFVLVAASIWFGVMGACREVVSEHHILDREGRSFLYLVPYLSAKMLTRMIVVGVQTGLLVAIVAPPLFQLSLMNSIALWAILWISAVTATALGLLVSCIARTTRFALTAVPLLLLHQLLFGGLLRPQVKLEEIGFIPNAVMSLTIQRWAFESTLAVDHYAENGVLRQHFKDPLLVDDLSRDRYAEFNLFKFDNISILHTFFKEQTMGRVLHPLAALGLQIFCFLIASYLILRWRFR